MGRIQAAAQRLKRAFGISTKALRCSACDRAKNGTFRFVSGPGVFLCESCIQTATTRLVSEGAPTTQARCRFCGQLRDTLSLAELQICASCVRLMENILAEDNQQRGRDRAP